MLHSVKEITPPRYKRQLTNKAFVTDERKIIMKSNLTAQFDLPVKTGQEDPHHLFLTNTTKLNMKLNLFR